MKELSPAALELFRTHHGMATAEMLSQANVGRHLRIRLVRAGVLEIRHQCVYRIMSAPLTLHARCAALCMAHEQGFVTGPTAGVLLGLRRMPKSSAIHFSVPHGSNVGPIDGVELRQSTKIRTVDTVQAADGIRHASAPRLAFDLARDLTADDHASIVEQVLSERRCTLSTLLRFGRDLAHPARPGSMQFLATLAGRGLCAAAQSHPEVLLDQALRAHGVPVVRQVRSLRLPNGRQIRLDLAVPEIRWGIEIDVHPDHLLLQGTTSDKRRDRQCHLIGWQVDRVTQLDLADLDTLVTELTELYRVRCAEIAA